MEEIAEFRVNEDFAAMLFGSEEGRRLGSVRKIELLTSDPRFKRIGKLQKETRAKTGRPFFFSWKMRRQYSRIELNAATCFRIVFNAYFEPEGEVRGTKYNEVSACTCCGAGAEQVGPLILDVKQIPKRKDFAVTIAEEVVVSRRVAEIFEKHAITGVSLTPVRMSAKSSAESPEWLQLKVTSANVEIVAPTRTGIDPFDDDEAGEYRCNRGDLLGLNLLSEVSVVAGTRGDTDFACSRQFVGVRRGVLRPCRIMFVSPKVRRLIEGEMLVGADVEIVHPL